MYVGKLVYDYELLNTQNDIYIYGAGFWGQRVLEQLELNPRINVKGFIDSYVSGIKINDYNVIKFDEAMNELLHSEIIVTGKYSREIFIKLLENNIKNIHVIICE